MSPARECDDPHLELIHGDRRLPILAPSGRRHVGLVHLCVQMRALKHGEAPSSLHDALT